MPSPRGLSPFRIGVRFRAPCPRAGALRGRLRGRARCLNFLCRICFWKARPARLRANRFTFACASRRGLQSGRAFYSAYPKAGMQPRMRRAITNIVRTVCRARPSPHSPGRKPRFLAVFGVSMPAVFGAYRAKGAGCVPCTRYVWRIRVLRGDRLHRPSRREACAQALWRIISG